MSLIFSFYFENFILDDLEVCETVSDCCQQSVNHCIYYMVFNLTLPEQNFEREMIDPEL